MLLVLIITHKRGNIEYCRIVFFFLLIHFEFSCHPLRSSTACVCVSWCECANRLLEYERGHCRQPAEAAVAIHLSIKNDIFKDCSRFHCFTHNWPRRSRSQRIYEVSERQIVAAAHAVSCVCVNV